jgi:hypothetical protein
MLLLVIGGLALAAFLAVWLGFVPPPYAGTLIRIRGGLLNVRRGQLRSDAREHLREILQEAGVSHGFIAVTAGNRVAFSRQIPPAVRQRLRNVLLNQWA